MSIKTELQEDLDSVTAAIRKAENAQSHGGGGKQTQYADITALYTRQKDLRLQLKRANGGGVYQGDFR